MLINSAKTVRDVVVEIPEATRIFEKLKIDYCCGGQKPLGEACASAGVDLQEIQLLLDLAVKGKEPSSVRFNEMSLTDLIDHIQSTHHVFTRDEMVRLDALITKVLSVHGENHPELREVDTLFKKLCDDLNPHLLKEERILFPYVMELERAATNKQSVPFAPFGTVNNPVRMMMMEHDAAGEILRNLRRVTNDYAVPADVCISYQTLYQALGAFEQDLHQHIHLENNILFPKAIDLERELSGFR